MFLADVLCNHAAYAAHPEDSMSLDLRCPVPEAINFHVHKFCDAKCRFCFAQFHDVRTTLATSDAKAIIRCLHDGGARKLNFAGGEPTLRRDIGELIRFAKALGLVTSIVTNGTRLERVLDEVGANLDWVALSIDSGVESVQHDLGRGTGDHVAKVIRLAQRCHDGGWRLKVNTVVTSLTWQEDMRDLILTLRPERWKVFQVLAVDGQNDGGVKPLTISPEQFMAFVSRHRSVECGHITLVPESNSAMLDSYAMIDPSGCFYGDTDGKHRVSRPILEVGVEVALAEVGFSRERLIARQGLYEW